MRGVTAYVEYVTAAPAEVRSRHCQGLHNGRFLPYGSFASGTITSLSIDRSIPPTCCRPAGRMNARTADHAWAWLQETDWLETARDLCEPAYHRICGHDPGAHAQGRRQRRHPGGVDGDFTVPHRAGRAVRDRSFLHAHLL